MSPGRLALLLAMVSACASPEATVLRAEPLAPLPPGPVSPPGPPGAAPGPPAPLPTPAPMPSPLGCEPAGALGTWRYSPSLDVLPDGRALVAGGRQHDGYGYLRSTELYDPATRRFAPGPPLRHERAMHSSIPLADGRILVVGGLTRAIEVYDPRRGVWQPAGRLPYAMTSVAVAAAPDGRVLIAGGDLWDHGALSADLHVWRPATSALARLGTLGDGFAGEAFVLPSGALLLWGAVSGGSVLDPWGTRPVRLLVDLDRGTTAPDSAADPFTAALAALGDPDHFEGAVIRDRTGAPASPPTVLTATALQQFDPATGRWQSVAALVRDHTAGAAVALDERTILVVGGLDEQSGVAEVCEIPTRPPAALAHRALPPAGTAVPTSTRRSQ